MNTCSEICLNCTMPKNLNGGLREENISSFQKKNTEKGDYTVHFFKKSKKVEQCEKNSKRILESMKNLGVERDLNTQIPDPRRTRKPDTSDGPGVGSL